MKDKNVIESLKIRYPNIHPLIFHRSVERTQSAGELFDVLEDMPTNFPVRWDHKQKRWVTTDLLQNIVKRD